MTLQGHVLNLQPSCRLNDKINLQLPYIIINCSLFGVPCAQKRSVLKRFWIKHDSKKKCIDYIQK